MYTYALCVLTVNYCDGAAVCDGDDKWLSVDAMSQIVEYRAPKIGGVTRRTVA